MRSSTPGDSGGPQFVNGELASITSFGLTFGPDFGDIDGTETVPLLDSTFGELAGYVPIYNSLGFLDEVLNPSYVPEPSTWAMMLVGFCVLGGMAPRRRSVAA